jgi:hypothetical protein
MEVTCSFRNIGWISFDYTVLYPRRQSSSFTNLSVITGYLPLVILYIRTTVPYLYCSPSSLPPFLLIGIVEGGVQVMPFGTATTNRPVVPAPGDYDDGEIGGMMIGRGNRSNPRKPAPVPLCPPQNPHAARTRTRAAAVGSQRLTAWAMARPFTAFIATWQQLCCIPCLNKNTRLVWLKSARWSSCNRTNTS